MRQLFTFSFGVTALLVAVAVAQAQEAAPTANGTGPVLAPSPILPAQPRPPQAPQPLVVEPAPQAPAVRHSAGYVPSIEPVPAQGYALPPGATVIGGSSLELYPYVKYRATRNVAPCPVTMIVPVKDPCDCSACGPAKCVNVQICAPNCPCPPTVTSSRDGNRTRYDFGKYAVNIIARKGTLIVDYDD